MARIRTIKPEIWQDEDLAALPAETMLLAIGLLNHADDEGYFKAHPRLIEASVFPLRDLTEDSVSIHGMLKQLENIGYVQLFQGVDGKQYGLVKNFAKHQKVNRPSPSKIKPLGQFTEDSVNTHGGLTAGTGNREQGKEQGTGEGVCDAPTPMHSQAESYSDVEVILAEDEPKQTPTNDVFNTSLHTIGGESQVVPFGGMSRNAPIADDWQPTDQTVEALRREGVSDEFIRATLSRFKNHYLANGRVFANWDAKFRAWVAKDFTEQRQQDSQRHYVSAAGTQERLSDVSWA